MGLNIDTQNNLLIRDGLTIPLKFKRPIELKVEPNIETIKVVEVNHANGDIYLPEIRINKNVMIKEGIYTAKNHKTHVMVRNDGDSAEVKVPIIQAQPIKKNEVFNINFDENREHLTKLNNLIRTEHMNKEEKLAIINLCKEYKIVFEKPNFYEQTKVQHEIITKDENPIFLRNRRTPYKHKEDVKNHVNELLEKGIIQPSNSPYGFPVHIVDKKMDASNKRKTRMVIDYRALNEKTVDDKFPLPIVEDILDRLGKCQYFSTLDLASGYHQINMHPNSIQKTAFNTEEGHFEFLKMPFGLKNAPATFQRLMNETLRGLVNKICMVYLDDIIIFSPNLIEHIKHLKLVFERLRQYNLKLQLDKCEFLRTETEFLGHIITPDGIKPNTKKIKAIQDFPIPNTQKELRGFLGLLGYYRKFIEQFAKITKPLTKCLKKNTKITHDKEFVETFNKCKTLLCNNPILAYPDFDQPFELTTDASNFALGAVLQQNDKSIAYASRTLNEAEEKYSTIEKELLAIVWATKHFRPYLFDNKFTLYTDHKPLEWLFTLKDPNAKLNRWKLKLGEYDFKVKYKKGKENVIADALSRIRLENYFSEIEIETLLAENENPNDIEDFEEYEDIINNLENDNATVHTSQGDVEIEIKYTDHPLNISKRQIIMDSSKNITRLVIRHHKLHENTKNRYYINIPENMEPESLVKTIKEYVIPNNKNTIYFKSTSLEKPILLILQREFNNSMKVEISRTFLEDIESKSEQDELIKYYHVGKTIHRGIGEMTRSLKKLYYWPNLDRQVQEFVNNCEICNRSKIDRHPQKEPIALTPTPNKPFELLHLDLFSVEKQLVLTIVDSFSKYGQAYPITDKNYQTICNAFTKYITHHGIPRRIITDNGLEFTNKIFKEFLKLHGIKHHETSVENSKSNGIVERFHSTLIESLRALKLEQPKQTLETNLYLSIMGYNNSLHTTTKFTPFEITQGTVTHGLPKDYLENKLVENFIKERNDQLKIINEQVKRNIENAKRKVQERQIELPKIDELTEGDVVFLKRNNQRQKLKPVTDKVRIEKINDRTIEIKNKKGKISKFKKSKVNKKKKLTKLLLQDVDQNNPGPSTSNTGPGRTD